MKAIYSSLLGIGLAGLMATTALSAPVQVTMLGTIKPEVSKEFDAAMQAYNASQDKYELKSIPLEGNALQQMTTLYASNNAPTIIVTAQEAAQFKDRLYDFTGSELVDHALENTLSLVDDGDKIYGVPITIEAFGILYNQSVLDQAVGGTFDPNSIHGFDDLSALVDEIKANTDAAPFTISTMDWSLGAHFSNEFFTNAASDLAGKLAVIDKLKAGDYDLASDPVFNGWLDTFDLMIANNLHADSPLSPTYDDNALELGLGEVGLWFQGNWASPMLAEVDPDLQVGMLPFPVSSDEDYAGNNSISVGVPLYFSVDASQSSPEEQAGAVDFISWLMLSDEGQKYTIGDMGFIPVYDNVTAEPENSLSKTVLAYAAEGRSLDWMNMYYPADAMPALGASLQKYLAGVIDRNGLAEEFEEYWSSAK